MEQSNTTASSKEPETYDQALRRLAQQALQVQSACNMSGIAQTFARVVLELRSLHPEFGTEMINMHPITQMWVSKLHTLAGMGLSDVEQFGSAYKTCEELAK